MHSSPPPPRAHAIPTLAQHLHNYKTCEFVQSMIYKPTAPNEKGSGHELRSHRSKERSTGFEFVSSATRPPSTSSSSISSATGTSDMPSHMFIINFPTTHATKPVVQNERTRRSQQTAHSKTSKTERSGNSKQSSHGEGRSRHAARAFGLKRASHQEKTRYRRAEYFSIIKLSQSGDSTKLEHVFK